jgi:hypothetical protein
MPKQPKPSKLIFMVKTAKRRTQPEEFKGELKMEHEQCHAWYKYISGELAKIAKVLESQTWPPGHHPQVSLTPQPEATPAPVAAQDSNPFEE